MSFILDALKKSDAERQRNTGPTLAEMPRRYRPPGRPWWVFALGGLLLINLLIFAVVLLRGTQPPPAAPAPPAEIAKAQAPVAAAPAAATVPPNPAPQPAPAPAQNSVAAAASEPPRSLADEAAISAPTEAEQAAFRENLAPAAAVPDRAPIVRSSAAPAASQPGGSNDESLPTINDLTGKAASALPELHLDLHVYATAAQSRFVSINGHKYTEGQKLNEGPVLERITRDGVVLNHQGLRFVLPRQ
jgi:general secretion pathway protein B